MTVQQMNSNISDDSDDMVSLPTEDELFRRKYQLLMERCEVLQQDNERILNRIQEAKIISKRYKKDIKLLVERLDIHRDPFRMAAIDVETKCEPAAKPPRSQRASVSIDKPATVKKSAPKRKHKSEKVEKDPNAPKKPCNAFFQFCQEQRPLMNAGMGPGTGGGGGEQELTRRLAERWRQLSTNDKQVYVAMFKRSKEKYAEEMSAYIKKEQ